ncbi:alpha/beta fold hydrolase [Micromonospora sp. LOL_023]|uniref:alpha/beta fold hydrolase n=1 Tax=Micromonospora sp. LOL_023 TaxID=3345418 RepID=UPI003A8BD604
MRRQQIVQRGESAVRRQKTPTVATVRHFSQRRPARGRRVRSSDVQIPAKPAVATPGPGSHRTARGERCGGGGWCGRRRIGWPEHCRIGGGRRRPARSQADSRARARRVRRRRVPAQCAGHHRRPDRAGRPLVRRLRHDLRRDRRPGHQALVYVAAFAPDIGDTVGGLASQFPGSRLDPTALDIRPYPGGNDGYIKTSLFRSVFAADVPAGTAAVMAATQRPAELATLGQPAGEPAWATIPSWTLVATDDQVIPAAAQRFMAQRAGAGVTEVKASHAVMVARPGPTTDVILAAIKGVS